MIRLGIVDFDSPHSIEFTRRFNHVGVDTDQWVEGAQIVLGCPGESVTSPSRIPEFTKQIAGCGVELVDKPQEMIGRIDAVLILSLCGSVHLDRVRPFFEAGVPAYVDKPFACSVQDARQMVHLAVQHRVVLFTSSALRFAAEVQQVHDKSADYGAVHGVVSYGPATHADFNPGLFHYGIHPTEVLLTLMGTGCEGVAAASTNETDVVTARWTDGRLATLRGNRQGATSYGFVAFCENSVVSKTISTRFAYRNLCQAIVGSFETNRPAVENETSLELVRFIAATLESERRGGEWVSLQSVD